MEGDTRKTIMDFKLHKYRKDASLFEEDGKDPEIQWF